ncbi:tetratricopeptide repeat protein [Streptomyces niveiscabiei]|uniref:ATP-binding protein n=1 Tax=Streptomyces niveiscabiei TaxID=164115 RepID=UPI0029ABA785|nr:tetratricopeptide repeat protein [Streptomyces niveiscabiei]MDX3383371.1 tetratricopeptide repeat protein [Streptomyces niveiscabiei]
MLGELLRGHRRRLGLSQEELADRSGVSVRTISHVETGRIARPRLTTVRQLADALDLTGPPRAAFQEAATGADPTPVPNQLPPAHLLFTGRTEHLARLDAALDGERAISAIIGTAGVGKTALAVHWAHRVADRFPDGSLYVNLRGFHPTAAAVTPEEAVRGFLTALDVPAERIDRDPEAQVGLYRSLLTGKRVLLLLDNARDAEQVRPLLPGTPGCLALVTSRNHLTGLVATEGAQPVVLDLLAEDEARHLLARRLGPARVLDAPDAVGEIVTRCARLPLALSVVAARAAMTPQFPLATYARELRDAGARLDPFAGDDPLTDVRAVFSWSYRGLTPQAARLFRLFGLHPGPDLTVPAAASLTGTDRDTARALLAELTRAHLLDQPAPGRHSAHDLLRAYAAELTRRHDPDPDRRAALRRLLDHHLHSAAAASEALSWYRDPVTLAAPDPAVTPETPAGHRQALDWCTAELPNLTAAVHTAARTGFETHAWQIAWTLVSYFDLAGHWAEWADTHETALRVARASADTVGEARTCRNLGRVRSRQGRHEEAMARLHRSLSLCRDAGDLAGQAQALRNLGGIEGRRGRYPEALDDARQALALFRAAGHRVGEGRALNQVAWWLSHLGDHRAAVEHGRESLRILQDLGDRDGEGATWDTLAHAHHHLGDHQEAITGFRHALRLRRERGDLAEIAESLDHLAATHRDAGDPAAAVLLWREALELLDRLGHPDARRLRARLRETADPLPGPGRH